MVLKGLDLKGYLIRKLREPMFPAMVAPFFLTAEPKFLSFAKKKSESNGLLLLRYLSKQVASSHTFIF